MYSYLYTLCLSLLLLPSLVALGTPETSGRPEEASTPPLDCSYFETFLSSGEFTLSYTATLGTECVTISTQLNFGADYTLEEVASDGTVLNGYTYAITAIDDQCALASAEDDCGVQLLAFNGDNTALTLTANGGTATLTPVAQNTNDWGIWQSYVILDAGLGNNYRAGGLNPDAVHPSFAGADLGAFASTGSTLSLNGGEIKTYKNNSANVCGGNIQYRVYSTGDTPGSFNGVALAFADDLGNGNQKWSKDDAGVDLLSGLTPGDYTLEIYWDADGDTFGGCGSTNYESNNGANYTASFSVFTPVYGCTDPAYTEYNASANTDDGSCSTLLDPCENALVLGSITVDLSTTTVTAEDGSATLTVTTGTPTSLTLSGINGAADYTIAQPGAIDGIAAGSYTVMATDVNGCTSDNLMLIMPYVQCCSCCGIYDSDTDGICDDSDNCINKLATNYADPNNVTCIVNGCTDTDYIEYNASATNDDGSCSTLIFEGCTNPTAPNYDAAANTDDGSCIIYGCMDQNYIEYNPAANTFNDSCSTLVVEGCTDPDYTEYNASANTDDGSCATLAPTCESPSMDGHSYGVVEIGEQCWFAENLRTTDYADGSAIPEVTDDATWSGLSSGARSDYDNAAYNALNYGRLYNWYAVTNGSGLCPSGWHVPTDEEWTALETYLGTNGHSGTEGTALKSTTGWHDTGNGTDDFGFSALPGGYRDSNGYFYNAGSFGRWWSSSPSGGFAWYRYLYSSNPVIYRDFSYPRYGISVRCLRDAD
jgi:uncharacterized protein (TIGR02145 family)